MSTVAERENASQVHRSMGCYLRGFCYFGLNLLLFFGPSFTFHYYCNVWNLVMFPAPSSDEAWSSNLLAIPGMILFASLVVFILYEPLFIIRAEFGTGVASKLKNKLLLVLKGLGFLVGMLFFFAFVGLFIGMVGTIPLVIFLGIILGDYSMPNFQNMGDWSMRDLQALIQLIGAPIGIVYFFVTYANHIREYLEEAIST